MDKWIHTSWWFQPHWKRCSSNWIISQGEGKNKTYVIPPPRFPVLCSSTGKYVIKLGITYKSPICINLPTVITRRQIWRAIIMYMYNIYCKYKYIYITSLPFHTLLFIAIPKQHVPFILASPPPPKKKKWSKRHILKCNLKASRPPNHQKHVRDSVFQIAAAKVLIYIRCDEAFRQFRRTCFGKAQADGWNDLLISGEWYGRTF